MQCLNASKIWPSFLNIFRIISVKPYRVKERLNRLGVQGMRKSARKVWNTISRQLSSGYYEKKGTQDASKGKRMLHRRSSADACGFWLFDATYRMLRKLHARFHIF